MSQKKIQSVVDFNISKIGRWRYEPVNRVIECKKGETVTQYTR